VKTEPRVTICIPSYNHGRFLRGAVESVLAQTYPNLECLIFDDGSSDDSRRIADDIQSRDTRVRVLSHDDRGNHGIAATLNAAFAAARGAYVGNLAADDVLLPDSVVRRMDAVIADPTIDLVYGRIEMLDSGGRPTGVYGGVSPEAMCGFDATEDPLQALMLHDYIPSPTVLMRLDLFTDSGGFSEDVYYNDWELWLRVVARGARLAFIDGAPLVGCRPGAYGDEADLPRRLELYTALADEGRALGQRFCEPRIRALVRLQQSLEAAQLGRMDEARGAIDSAFHVDPMLSGDVDYLLWWLAPLRRRRLPGLGAPSGASWVEAASKTGIDAARAVAEGARAGYFVCWAIEAVADKLSEPAVDRVRWAAIGDELELTGSRFRPGVLLAGLTLALRAPRLLRERRFVKVLLCAGGVWPVAARIRRIGSAK
jgi:glycosyltransferase involved in cell wall biosynthesis